MADSGKKKGRRKYKNLNISGTKFFIVFKGQSFGEKQRFDKK